MNTSLDNNRNKDMTAETKATPTKKSLNVVVSETTEKLEKVAVEAKEQAVESIEESKEKIEAEAKQFTDTVQEQLRQFKQDVLHCIEGLKEQLLGSQKDLTELKAFIKTEFNTVIEDLSKLGKELKDDVSQISSKHKVHLTDTFKRSKDSTIEVLKKVNPVVKAEVLEKETQLKS